MKDLLYSDIYTFIVLPIKILVFKILIIKGFSQPLRIVIINFAPTMEFIFEPLTLISKLTRFIVKASESIHLIILPLSLIISSISVIKGSLAVSLTIIYHSFVVSSILVIFLAFNAFLLSTFKIGVK